jgi:hypothetical protein
LRLSVIPDLRAWPRLLGVALSVGLAVSLILAAKIKVAGHYGDTDDAMRLVMARDLLGGQGWYDPLIRRLQPPEGLYMHWSRLLDGGLAGAIALMRTFLSPAAAEIWVRTLWPMAWIFPAVATALVIARNLGASGAVVLTGVLLITNLSIYQQFVPGRIDHHNIQIVMALAALAGATAVSREALWAAVAGMAAGLGLGIGLEALALQGLIGASYALRLALDRRRAASTGAYGLALGLTSVAIFLIQTPPWRWSLSFCDALALNSTLALAVAGFGLGLAAWAAPRAPAALRVGILGASCVGALATYLALDPACLHGPFAHVDPRVQALWLGRVQEVQPLWSVFVINRNGAIQASLILALSGAAGFYMTLRQWPGLKAETLLVLIALAGATIMAILVWRMMSYAFWIGVPLLGAGLSHLVARRLRNLLLPSVVATLLVSPAVLGWAAVAAVKAVAPKAPPETWRRNLERCFAPAAFVQLAALPPGRVLAPADIGPFILLFTPHAAMTAPYHRMGRAMLAAHEALDGPPGLDEARVRALGARYIVDCRGLVLLGDRPGLAARLRAGEVPSWLGQVSPPGAALQIYRVTAQPAPR